MNAGQLAPSLGQLAPFGTSHPLSGQVAPSRNNSPPILYVYYHTLFLFCVCTCTKIYTIDCIKIRLFISYFYTNGKF